MRPPHVTNCEVRASGSPLLHLDDSTLAINDVSADHLDVADRDPILPETMSLACGTKTHVVALRFPVTVTDRVKYLPTIPPDPSGC